eukprot:TRINITY_DN1673_c0_g1_i1.p1 TRINITY_DN1673_c0_g1~~TRINITY_DN1673_c0_g1_i1.p1  ORF type:complete len:801 (+),score=181.09 TRINITY_DN1673_c0_g1_i1:126-2405(+)
MVGSKRQQMHDLGFDDADLEQEDQCREMQQQLDESRRELMEVRKELQSVRETEARSSQKLISFQQVNRSQSSLMRAELQKYRRRLAHTQAVAAVLRDRFEWYKANAQHLSMPENLQYLPTEEDAVEEAADLAKLHQRWESDVSQLQAELLAGFKATMAASPETAAPVQPAPAPVSHAAPAVAAPTPPAPPIPNAGPGNAAVSAAHAAEMEAIRRQVGELEAQLQQRGVEFDRQAQLNERLKIELKKQMSAVSAGASKSAADSSAAAEQISAEAKAQSAATAEAAAASEAALRKDLENSQKETKDSMKKLKQLATAYKAVEASKKEAEAALGASQKALSAANEELAKPKAPVRMPISKHLVDRVNSLIAAERQQLAEIRAAVTTELKQGLPQSLQQVMASKSDDLTKLMESGCKEWKQKFQDECDKRRKLHNLVQELKGNIRVYVRVRPLNEREESSCVSFPALGEISIFNEASSAKKTWQFNEVYDTKCTQEKLFSGVRDLVVSMIDGYNVCIFAYGQTGAGKTHSMQGIPSDPGIYLRTFRELFNVASGRTGWTVEFKAAVVEIYNEEIRDLLVAADTKNRPKLQVRQGKEGNFVPNLTVNVVTTPEDVDGLLSTAQQNRTVAATDMNAHSSRSHLMVQIFGSMTTPEGKKSNSVITLVDLAGSERLAKSGVSGDRAKEAIAINKSLSALGDVINARATKSSHTPFRNSPLTHMLQDSLSGDSKTLMLMQINPCGLHVEESLCSLQFGARVNAVEMKK